MIEENEELNDVEDAPFPEDWAEVLEVPELESFNLTDIILDDDNILDTLSNTDLTGE